jgi:hypothetical protein
MGERTYRGIEDGMTHQSGVYLDPLPGRTIDLCTRILYQPSQ